MTGLTSTVARLLLFGMVLMDIGVDKTFGWIAGLQIGPSNDTSHNLLGNCHRPKYGARSGSRSSSSPPHSPSSSTLFATCRICHGSYDPLFNKASQEASGARSPRKSDWEEEEDYGEDGKHLKGGIKKKSIDNSQLVYTYNCCGGGPESEGCTKDKCKSFDDP
ncbi:hypothetical protein FRACYDRAFT_247968 [Fragilariopsis cylindrus CCMP1102]|uniref:Uncharacterized protein n=1 Tax=Fragilariopsis cylindrus CCMP1102 TaxID=635003 RepID=A0A1E7EUZ9_9STRA|nr:hypothetical protein FRACYDRAFT_247968 [Fragilariopsis cylindrus CCMP1102]|eukprot:OEU09712.1 hypothetical protein FRACYDRAFT_247968 [Fragilariopsis cylindrus CCMP1102]